MMRTKQKGFDRSEVLIVPISFPNKICTMLLVQRYSSDPCSGAWCTVSASCIQREMTDVSWQVQTSSHH